MYVKNPCIIWAYYCYHFIVHLLAVFLIHSNLLRLFSFI